MTLGLRFVTHSEVGLVRKNNQDSGFASEHLLVVADGMGGAAAGDLASAVAIDALRAVDGPPETDSMLDDLADAIHEANERIADLVEDDLSLDGMGTTVTGALFDGTKLGLAHIGDSRAYLMRDGELERLTHDHSWVQSLVDAGKISSEEAAVHPHRSLLLKVLNGQRANDPDLSVVTVRPGDRLLFCSDGVCGLVDDADIADALRIPDLEESLRRLVQLAHAAGGVDNITAILADVVDGEPTGGVQLLGAAAERTVPPAVAPSGAEDEATDTAVDGIKPVTVEDEARYTPQPPRKRRVGRMLAGLAVLVLVLGAALGTGYAWTRTQYFVGASGEQVAIFQGLPEGIPGIPLSRVYEVQDLPLADLPGYYQALVRSTIEVDSLDAARATVDQLSATAKRCESRPRPSPSATPTPTPATPSGAATGLGPDGSC